jgi:hypothetical protein
MPLRFSPNRGAAALSLNAAVRGPTGAAATATVGTTTTAAEGTSATVVNSGTTAAAVFDFTIPRGAIPAVGFNFNTATTDSDKNAGDVWFNNATPASVTTIYFDNADRDGNTVTGWLDSFDDSTSTSKGTLTFTPAASPAGKLVYRVTGSVVDGTGYRKVTVTHKSGATLPSNGAHLGAVFAETGEAGDVTGAGLSVSGNFASWNGTGGNALADSGYAAIDEDNMASDSATKLPTQQSVKAYADLKLAKASNLSDVANAATSRTNLGVGTGDSPEFTAVNIGHASDTTVSRAEAGVIAVESVPLYSQVPQNSQSTAYTLVLADAQKHILHPSSDNNARTFTIPANASVAYPVGTAITFVNEINTVTIAITSDTLTLAGAGSTGSRTLAANGMATALKIASTKWVISGTGLT